MYKKGNNVSCAMHLSFNFLFIIIFHVGKIVYDKDLGNDCEKSSGKYKFLLSLSFTLILTTCSSEFELTWDCPYPALFYVATSSILGAQWFIFGEPPRGLPPHIQMLEEDSFGRILFVYTEDNHTHYRVTMQKIENGYVYFYPHYNFIISPIERRVFAVEDIESFKDTNNWEQEMSNCHEFVRVRIVRQRERGFISNEKLAEAHYRIFPSVTRNYRNAHLRMVFLREDSYGRSIYAGIGLGSEWIGTTIAVLFQSDNSFNPDTGILLITEPYNYQTELRLFMEFNGWNISMESFPIKIMLLALIMKQIRV
jgi:hypothetical protein